MSETPSGFEECRNQRVRLWYFQELVWLVPVTADLFLPGLCQESSTGGAVSRAEVKKVASGFFSGAERADWV